MCRLLLFPLSPPSHNADVFRLRHPTRSSLSHADASVSVRPLVRTLGFCLLSLSHDIHVSAVGAEWHQALLRPPQRPCRPVSAGPTVSLALRTSQQVKVGAVLYLDLGQEFYFTAAGHRTGCQLTEQIHANICFAPIYREHGPHWVELTSHYAHSCFPKRAHSFSKTRKRLCHLFLTSN